MTLIEVSSQAASVLPEADTLIEEARQRQRKRRLWLGSIVLIVVVAAGVWAASGGMSGTKPPLSANKPGHIKTPLGAPGSASGRLNGQTYPVGQVVVSADGRTITTMAIDECGREPSLLARSYPNRVSLAVVGPVLPRNTICPRTWKSVLCIRICLRRSAIDYSSKHGLASRSPISMPVTSPASPCCHRVATWAMAFQPGRTSRLWSTRSAKPTTVLTLVRFRPGYLSL